ncbi:MAG: S8 family serine peptidase, partial [Candidatus Omnitrophota bacterium]
NVLLNTNNAYERYIFDNAGNLLEKVYLYDDISVDPAVDETPNPTDVPDFYWHQASNFTVVLGDGMIHPQDDLIYGSLADLEAGTGLIMHCVYTYHANGRVDTKEIYDNAGTTKNDLYEKYTFDDTGVLLEKIYFYDDLSLDPNADETPGPLDAPDNLWHRASNFTGILGDMMIHPQDDLIYGSLDDLEAGINLVMHCVYTYHANGRVQTKELYDNAGTVMNTAYEKYTYDISGNLIEKICYFDGTSLDPNTLEVGEPDNKWHRYRNYTAQLGDGEIHPQNEQVYNVLDYGTGTLLERVAVYDYSYHASGRIDTKWDWLHDTHGTPTDYTDDSFDHYKIYGYRDEDYLSEGYGRIEWQMMWHWDASPGPITTMIVTPYNHYWTGTRVCMHKSYFKLRVGTTNTWDYQETWIYKAVQNDQGEWIEQFFGTTYNPAYGGVTSVITRAIPPVPAGGGPSTLELNEGLKFNDTSEGLLQEDLETFLQKYDELKNKTAGEGVTIAILDSGIDTNRLDIDIAGGYDFAGQDRNDGLTDEDYSDVIGHGTATASVIVGENGEGVAPEADILAVKVFDDEGRTTSSILASAIKYAVDSGARVLAMPLSLFPVYNDLQAAIDYAVDKGAILIAAAGNEGCEVQDDSLAANDKVITVGSYDDDGKLSSWSNYGSALDILAPWDVVTLDDAKEEAGTSYSAAFISGVVALMLSEDPEMTTEDVLQELWMLSAGKTKDEAGYKGYDTLALKDMPLKKPGQEIKGVNIDEVVSKQEVERENRSEFTGYSIIDETEQYKRLLE